MELCAVGQLTINYKVISIFKNNFWKNILTTDTNIENDEIIESKIIVKSKKSKDTKKEINIIGNNNGILTISKPKIETGSAI